MTARQAKQSFGKRDEEGDHLCRVDMRVKELEPTVASLADTATIHCRTKPADKTASELRAMDWGQRPGRYCSGSEAAPYRRRWCRQSAGSSPADAPPGRTRDAARAMEAWRAAP